MASNRRWVLPLLIVALAAVCPAKERRAEGSLTVELPASYAVAAQVVSEVAADGIIRGTGEYRTETQITGAQPAQSSPLLTTVAAPGASVFYKVRPGTVAPRNYKDSTDQGMLVVAYTVEKISDDKTRLTIESVFVPDSRHGRSASDGSVEACEFTAIETRLKTLAEQKKEAQELQANEQKEVQVRTLRRQLADEQARHDALAAEVQELQKRSTELRALAVVKTKSAAARLQAAPYAHSESVQSLMQGQELDVLYRTSSWYRVRTADGQAGWVYASFLEPVQ